MVCPTSILTEEFVNGSPNFLENHFYTIIRTQLPHAYECGVNVPGMIIKNIIGRENKSIIGQYEEGIYMMKYSEIKIRR